MTVIEIPSWISDLYDTSFALARILVAAAFIVAVALIARRKPRLYSAVAFLGVSVVMAGIAWHLHYVTKTEATLITVHGPVSDTNPADDYMKVQAIRPSDLVMAVSALLLIFLVVQVYRAARAKMTLTTGAGVVAILMFLIVGAEFIRSYGDMFSPLWTNMNGVSAALWMGLFYVVIGYVVFAGILLTHRMTLQRERRRTPVSPAPASSLTGAGTAH